MYKPIGIVAVVASGSDGEGIRDRLGPIDPVFFQSTETLLAASDLPAGIVLLGPDVALADAADLSDALGSRGGDWAVVRLQADSGSGDLIGQPVTVGYRQSLDDLIAAMDPAAPAPLLELGVVLRHVAKARHDINNPLTSAMAETQLLLMDVEDAEVRESLETVQHQIRRIRDLVADLSVLRPPTA